MPIGCKVYDVRESSPLRERRFRIGSRSEGPAARPLRFRVRPFRGHSRRRVYSRSWAPLGRIRKTPSFAILLIVNAGGSGQAETR